MKKEYLLLYILFTVNLFAQTFSLGPQIGITKSIDADKTNLTPFLAARLEILNLTVEGSIGYKVDEYDDGKITTRSFPLQLTGMIGILPIVDLEAGIAWYNSKIEFTNNSLPTITKNKPAYHAGFGTSIPLGNIILTGDLRYVFLDLDLKNVNLESLKSNYYNVQIGLLFKL